MCRSYAYAFVLVENNMLAASRPHWRRALGPRGFYQEHRGLGFNQIAN